MTIKKKLIPNGIPLLVTFVIIGFGWEGFAMDLPEYVCIEGKDNRGPEVLHTAGKKLTFPLSPEDLADVRILEQKFDHEENCAGLAAPQIGISKQIIIFSAPEDPKLKKWRADFTQTMEKTLWINPTYEGMGTDTNEDYEGCFSANDLAGPVKRFKKIQYTAYDLKGQKVEGIAEGFLARIIQHEIDHVKGRLFIELVPKDQLLTIEEYRRRRAAAMES